MDVQTILLNELFRCCTSCDMLSVSIAVRSGVGATILFVVNGFWEGSSC